MKKEKTELKICDSSDIDTLRELGEETYRATFAPYNTEEDMEAYIHKAFAVQRMEEELGNPASVFVLALLDGRAAGYTKLNYAPAQTELNDAAALEVERIYVRQRFQGRHLGQQLLDYAIKRAAQEGMAYLWLGVWENNDGAIRFYQRNGFTRFGEHVFMLGADEQTDYLMRREL